LTPEVYHQLMGNFDKLNFVYDFGEPLKEYVSNSKIIDIHE